MIFYKIKTYGLGGFTRYDFFIKGLVNTNSWGLKEIMIPTYEVNKEYVKFTDDPLSIEYDIEGWYKNHKLGKFVLIEDENDENLFYPYVDTDDYCKAVENPVPYGYDEKDYVMVDISMRDLFFFIRKGAKKNILFRIEKVIHDVMYKGKSYTDGENEQIIRGFLSKELDLSKFPKAIVQETNICDINEETYIKLHTLAKNITKQIMLNDKFERDLKKMKESARKTLDGIERF